MNFENVQKIMSFVRCLLQNLNALPEISRISYREQAAALRRLADEYEQMVQTDE